MSGFSTLGGEAVAHILGIHRLTERKLCFFPELDLGEALLFPCLGGIGILTLQYTLFKTLSSSHFMERVEGKEIKVSILDGKIMNELLKLSLWHE